MYIQNRPIRRVRAFGPPRLAAGCLVTLSLLAGCGTDSKNPLSPANPTPSGLTSIPSAVLKSNFAVLANAALTCTGGSITGDVGTFQAVGSVTVTSCPIAGRTQVGDSTAIADYHAFLTAYDVVATTPCDQVLTGTLAGVTLAPGVYCFDAAATVTGVLTLNGPSTGNWGFKIGTGGTGALTGTGFSVVMAGGGLPSNVIWWVAQATTMTDSHFLGLILGGAAITLTRGTMNGSAFAKADVTITGTALVGGTAAVSAPPPVTSGFAVLANAAVTCTDGTISGEVGTFKAVPTGAITLTSCLVTGKTHVGDSLAIPAYNGFLASYAAAATTPCGQVLTGTLAGVTLAPGVYCFDAAATLTGLLTLNGPSTGSWVFKIGTGGTGALTGTSFSVAMAGGGLPSRVTWWVAQGTTMTDSRFIGTILGGAGITLTRGSMNGSAWAKADVTITGTALAGGVHTSIAKLH